MCDKVVFCTTKYLLSLMTELREKGKGGRGGVQGKGEGFRKNWERVQVLWICRGVGVFSSRVIRDEYRN